MHKEMDMWYIKSLALHCFSVASWRFEHRTSLKGDHCLHTCAGKHQPYWHAIHNFQTRTVYKVKVSDFIMSLFTISGLQLLYDCNKFIALHFTLVWLVQKICSWLFSPDRLELGSWLHKLSCYQLSQPCLLYFLYLNSVPNWTFFKIFSHFCAFLIYFCNQRFFFNWKAELKTIIIMCMLLMKIWPVSDYQIIMAIHKKNV